MVFLYDRKLGIPEEISKQFSQYFPDISENLVLENLLGLAELKEIIDKKRIYWAGIKENFDFILDNNDSIGKIAWKVFKDFIGKEPSEEVKSLVYNGAQAPWKFSVMVCVIYE
ncbi:MAG: hypothetical protein ACFE8M_01885 [Candidatus Hermodarchaeota archaeon]